MRILMVTHHVPRPTWGAGTRNFYFLKALARHHTVSLLSLVDATDPTASDAGELRDILRTIRLVPLRPARMKRINQVLSLLRGRSPLLDAHTLPEAQRTIDELFQREGYDLVLYESAIVAGYRLPTGVPFVIDQHNIEYEVLRRTYERESSPVRKWFNWVESHLVKPEEIARCRAAQGVVVTSAREAEVLRAVAPDCAVTEIPNGVDIAAFTPAPVADEVPGRVIFTGTMAYYPNVQAVLFFAEQCWPRVRAEIPDATWEIVGASPTPEVLRLGELPGVTVTGSVPSVQPHMAAAQVALAPLLIGGGTRLKILEALAAGTPVVSTTLGCEGLDIVPGQHLLLADSPEDIAASVIMLLRDSERRAQLAAAGRSLVEEHYSWESCGQRLLDLLTALGGEESTYAGATGATLGALGG